MIVGTGTYSYNRGPYRDYFVSRMSQNTVDVAGARYDRSGATSVLFQSRTPSAFGIAVRVRRYADVSDTRTVVFSRRLGYLVVDDRLIASSSRKHTQMWHLFPGATVATSGRTVRTTSSGGSIVIKQLALAPTTSVLRGATDPIQGWRTMKFNSKVVSPAVLAQRSGRSVRFLTLIVPVPSPTSSVKVLYSRYSSRGFSVVVSIDGKREHMTLDGTAVSVRSLN
jgi:hypothetical protein